MGLGKNPFAGRDPSLRGNLEKRGGIIKENACILATKTWKLTLSLQLFRQLSTVSISNLKEYSYEHFNTRERWYYEFRKLPD